MLVPMPWKVRSAALASWQLAQPGTAEATAECIATVMTGVLEPAVPVSLKPPEPKLVAEWQLEQAIEAGAALSGAMWVLVGVTMAATPFQLMATVWQLWQVRVASGLWPAARGRGGW